MFPSMIGINVQGAIKALAQYGIRDSKLSMYVDSLTRAITKTRLYDFDPLKPHFYLVKLGFTGV